MAGDTIGHLADFNDLGTIVRSRSAELLTSRPFSEMVETHFHLNVGRVISLHDCRESSSTDFERF
jgi:hypothetical protein